MDSSPAAAAASAAAPAAASALPLEDCLRLLRGRARRAEAGGPAHRRQRLPRRRRRLRRRGLPRRRAPVPPPPPQHRVGESGGREGGGARGVPAARRDRARRARARPGGCGRRGGRLHCAPRRRGCLQIVRTMFLVSQCSPIEQTCEILPNLALGFVFCVYKLWLVLALQITFADGCKIICRPDLTITEECFELLSLVAIASEDGAYKFCEPGVMGMLFGQISNFPDGSRCLELATHLMQLLVHKLRADNMSAEKLQGMASLVTSLAMLFGVLHTAVKFESLHMLTTLLSQKESPLHGALRSMPSTIWESHIRGGIIDVLQNRVVSSEKLQALLLAECMMSILGESWLSEDHEILGNKNSISVDKFILLVLQSARVEVAVLLNELAFLKYESSKSSQTDDAISQKQRNLAILFSLIERIIEMISYASSREGEPSQIIQEKTIMQTITGLNETISLVLDFLQDAKDHGQRKGDDLLAAVRIVGSYLAETPYACQEKTGHLLEFIFSIEGQDELRPFYSVRFMLPMLSQLTTTADGCRTLVSFGGHKAVIDYLTKVTEQNGMTIDNGSMFMACDTVINIMSNRKNSHIQMEPCFIRLLQALITWAGTTDVPSVTMTASSLCAMVLELTSEEFLLSCSDFDAKTLESLSDLIVRGLRQDIPDDDLDDHCEQYNQKETIVSGYRRWADRFPSVRNVVHQHVSV